jgi:hypothetical protein
VTARTASEASITLPRRAVGNDPAEEQEVDLRDETGCEHEAERSL